MSDRRLSVCPSVSRGPHWTYFREIWYSRLRKSGENIQILLKSYIRNGHYFINTLSTFMLLAAVWNILYLDNSKKWNPLYFHGNTERFYIVDSYM